MTESRLIAFLVVPPFVLLDLAGPLDTVHAANRIASDQRQAAPYRTLVVSEHGGPVETDSGIALHTTPMRSLEAMRVDTLIAVGGTAFHQLAALDSVGDWLRVFAPQVRRVCSVCVGAFVLGAAGLLDGRHATTHWLNAPLLQKCYPNTRVEPDAIYVREDPVWTSAGITAGIDLGLALVEDDLGVDMALQAARRLVVFLKRPGGQSQFSQPLQGQFAAGAPFGELHAWMAERLDGDLSVVRLADQANMSPRTFARNYLAETGSTPAKAVERIRLEAARFALLDTAAPLKRIAARVGFGDEQNLRRAFQRQYGVAPAAYRERFGATANLATIRKPVDAD